MAICEEQPSQLLRLLEISPSLSQMPFFRRPDPQLSLPALCQKYCKVRLQACPCLIATITSCLYMQVCNVGGAQNAEALFHQTQPGTQQAGSQAYQQTYSSSHEPARKQEAYAPPDASDLTAKSAQGRMLTFVSGDGKAMLSSSVAADNPSPTGKSACYCNLKWATYSVCLYVVDVMGCPDRLCHRTLPAITLPPSLKTL